MPLAQLRRYLQADTNTVGISDTLGFKIIDLVQKMMNLRFGRVVSNSDITLDANTGLFDIRTKIAAASNILAIYEAGTLLHRVPSWREFVGYDYSWLSTTSTAHLAWAQIGAGLLAVYPIVTTNKTVTVYYAALPTTIDEETDSLEIAGEDEDFLYTICEAIMHLHMRNYKEAKSAITRVNEMMPTEFPATLPPKAIDHG